MSKATKKLIERFKLEEIGIDFMGYEAEGNGIYTFHHIIPKRSNGMFSYKNGAILRRGPHDYIHIIEQFDPEVFEIINGLLKDMNQIGYLDRDILLRIDDILTYFEREFAGERTKKGKLIIKEEYTRRRKI